jgi:hypothetical protein
MVEQKQELVVARHTAELGKNDPEGNVLAATVRDDSISFWKATLGERVDGHSAEEISRQPEPGPTTNALIFKLRVVGENFPKQDVVATDVTFFDENGSFGKPERDEECQEIDAETGVPQKIKKRYCQENGSPANWNVGVGFRLADGSMRVAFFTIQGHVPQLTPKEVREFYLPQSSAGLGLVEFLEIYRDNNQHEKGFSEPIFYMSNTYGKNRLRVPVSLDLMRQLVVNKVPPISTLEQLLSNKEFTVAEIDGVDFALVSIALMNLARTDLPDLE